MLKTCSNCKIEKPFEQFGKDKYKKDGLLSRCKECVKIYREENKEAIKKYREENKEAIKKYREENKEKISEQQKKYKKENKEAIKKRLINTTKKTRRR